VDAPFEIGDTPSAALYRSAMRDVTREDVIALVGELDGEILEQILAIRPSRDQLVAMLASLEDELGFDDQRTERGSVEIQKLRAVLAPIVAARAITRGRD
jgi:hypothetical protein